MQLQTHHTFSPSSQNSRVSVSQTERQGRLLKGGVDTYRAEGKRGEERKRAIHSSPTVGILMHILE
jgi:hypothetical protein